MTVTEPFARVLAKIIEEEIGKRKDMLVDGGCTPERYQWVCGEVRALRSVLEEYYPEVEKKLSER